MKKLTIILFASLLLASCSNSLTSAAQSNISETPDGETDEKFDWKLIELTGVGEYVKKNKNHTAKLIFETKLFDESKHKIVRAGSCDFTIDGREPLGAECQLPKTEIASMRFFFDGVEIPVSPELYSDCYSPPHFKDSQGKGWLDNSLIIRFSDDMESVFLFLRAGDGGASYQIIWVLRKDGKHTRFSQMGGDCHFLNFGCPLGSE